MHAHEPTASPPSIPSVGTRWIVHRDRVLDVLRQNASARLVFLHAPAGYGKTTVLAQWVAEDPRPAVWLSVRPGTDAPWLVHCLIDALADAGLLAHRHALPHGRDTLPWHLGLLPLLERTLFSIGRPFLLVIDDAGSMSGEDWNALLASIAHGLPDGGQLVLASRVGLPSSLRSLTTVGEAAVLGPKVLAFDALEGAELMRRLGVDLGDADLLALLEETEGWPVAVGLCGLATRTGGLTVPVGACTGSGGQLPRYVREEILGALDPDDARFLLRSSVLAELDEESCRLVTGVPDSLARLRRLAACDQLVVPLDASFDRFRMHSVLAGLLSEELRTIDSGSWHTAHGAAARAAENVGDLDAAVFHARCAEDDAALSALIWRFSGALLSAGRTPVLRRWVDGLSAERLCSRAGLSLAAAWVAAQEGDTVRASRFALAAEAAAQQDATWVPDVRLLRATVCADGLETMSADARDATDAKPPNDVWVTLGHYLEGMAELLLGRTEAGQRALHEGYRLSVVLDAPTVRGLCLAALADAAFAAGDRQRALDQVRELRELLVRHRLDGVATMAPVFVTSAVGYVAESRFAEARHEAARAARLTALLHAIAPWYAVQGRIALANVYLSIGDVDKAAALAREAQSVYGPAISSPVLAQALAGTRLRLDEALGSMDASSPLTSAEVRVLQFLPTHLSFPEIAAELCVSRHTVKTQALAAYRKLGAHTRTEAIDKAREMGLLPRQSPAPGSRRD